MKGQRIPRFSQFTRNAGGVAVGFFLALLGTFRDLFAAVDISDEEENDVSAGAYRGGALNYRTGKLDDGTDPYGWYEND